MALAIEDLAPAQQSAVDLTLQTHAEIGRDAVFEEQLLLLQRESLPGVPDDQVGVVTGCDAPLPRAEASKAGGVQARPARQVEQRRAARLGVGPQGGEAERERGDATPGVVEVAPLELLELRRTGAMIRDHEVDDALQQPAPEGLAVFPAADRRRALEERCTVRDRLGIEAQVVRAGLDAD